MRRKDRERDKAFAYDVIDHCEYGVAALAGGEEGPYCVPLSMVRGVVPSHSIYKNKNEIVKKY